jgi:hypothetical protein
MQFNLSIYLDSTPQQTCCLVFDAANNSNRPHYFPGAEHISVALILLTEALPKDKSIMIFLPEWHQELVRSIYNHQQLTTIIEPIAINIRYLSHLMRQRPNKFPVHFQTCNFYARVITRKLVEHKA